jgi:hypothetical protein
MREASTFFRATNDSILDDKYKVFRDNISMYMKMGRRGMYFFADTQSASETRGILSGSEDILLMFKNPSYRDKEELTFELIRERRMRREQISNMSFLAPGACYVALTGKNVKCVQITLPRTAYWKKEYGNFYRNVWEKFNGEWSYTEETKDYIDDRCKIKKKPIANLNKEFIDKTLQPPIIRGEGIIPEEIPQLGEKFELPDETKDINIIKVKRKKMKMIDLSQFPDIGI